MNASTRIDGGGSGLSLHEKIDICRGVFAALVVMAHAVEVSWGVHRDAVKAMGEPLHAIIFGVFGTGTYYVFGFFVLSGYCIHLSVERSLGTGRFPVGRYTVARLSRILPLYYLGLAVAVVVEFVIAEARPWEWPNGLDVGAFVSQIFMVQYLTQTFGVYASSWSLTNEVFYYALYGLLVSLMAGTRSARPAWVGLGVCLGVAIVAQGLYLTIGHNQAVYRTGGLFGLGTLWFEGVLIAVHGKAWVRIPWVRTLARFWPAVLAFVIAWKTALLPPHGLYLMSGLAFSLMLLHLIASSSAETPVDVGRWRRRIVTTLGLASYPTYLFHGPLLMLVGSWVIRTGAIRDWKVTFALLLGVGLASGPPLGWLVEHPVMAWRSSLLKRWGQSTTRGVPGRPSAVPRPSAVGVHS